MKRLTTHVLDTAKGRPGAGIRVDLYEETGTGRRLVKSLKTNSDGRTDEPLLEGDAFKHGRWELVFHVADYFAAHGEQLPDPPFLDEVSLRFGIGSDAHYHVPLLVSPWSYSTYRGS
ncbi:MAG: hydroxyisourate hydrolase [Gammaproteobacteria bacterium]|nr:hydroxyisourate hydrolase [Gammaproteobacteria bacterium]